jgi:protein-disulfide isomerase
MGLKPRVVARMLGQQRVADTTSQAIVLGMHLDVPHFGAPLARPLVVLCWIMMLLGFLLMGRFGGYAGQVQHNLEGDGTSVCSVFDEDAQIRIANYLSQVFALPVSRLRFKGSQLVNSTCYRQIRFYFEDFGHDKEFYLSPDGRFLADTLYDTSRDPTEERKARDNEVTSFLKADASPFMGKPTAPVTIVEFGDFQCPYCKQLAEMMKKEYSGKDSDKLFFIYKQFPLPRHAWATLASEGSVCAWLQQPAVFWQLHDFVFASQSSLTLTDIEQRMSEFVADNTSLDVEKFKNCLKNGTGAAIVRRDGELAARLGVTGTPTLFVNGVKIVQVRNIADLELVIRRAMSGDLPSGPQLGATSSRDK